jgi:hypothetical protein
VSIAPLTRATGIFVSDIRASFFAAAPALWIDKKLKLSSVLNAKEWSNLVSLWLPPALRARGKLRQAARGAVRSQ